mmetsp:Transcript_28238/g.62272  ORF Transcript_28238/g.62272 Transcript_28238/m.62272 type:complete len:138 (+) Transcript_28238:467-880(+)
MAGQPAFRPAYGFDKASPLGPKAATGEVVPGLNAWLKHMGLDDYIVDANAWCQEMGAAVLLEVIEELDSLAEDLPMQPEEKERLRKRGRFALSTMEQRGELLRQEPVVIGDHDKDTEFRYAGRTLIKKKEKKFDDDE